MVYSRYFILNIFFVLIFPSALLSQKIILQNSSSTSSLRGLSVVNDKIAWVSGSKGTVGRSIDGGKTWKYFSIPGFTDADFRDIEAFDAKTAVVMNIQNPACILKTNDGGISWKKTFSFADTTLFLDAMEFWNEQSGILLGDPINNHFFIARTFDGGESWQVLPPTLTPVADSGEACFASSGTNVRRLNKKEAVFVSGGSSSHFYYRNERINLPLVQGRASTGANSIAIKDKNTLIVVGGDFTQKEDTVMNSCYSYDGGNTWVVPEKRPTGYRSCVEYINKQTWITCGLNGADISGDNGKTWNRISNVSFHVVRKSKKGKAVFFAGNNGRIGKLENN